MHYLSFPLQSNILLTGNRIAFFCLFCPPSHFSFLPLCIRATCGHPSWLFHQLPLSFEPNSLCDFLLYTQLFSFAKYPDPVSLGCWFTAPHWFSQATSATCQSRSSFYCQDSLTAFARLSLKTQVSKSSSVIEFKVVIKKKKDFFSVWWNLENFLLYIRAFYHWCI